MATSRVIAWGLAFLFTYYLPQAVIRQHWDSIVQALARIGFGLGLPVSDASFAALAVGSVGTNLVLVILFNLAFLPVYYYSSYFEAYRCDASEPWPWHSLDKEKRQRFWTTVAKAFAIVSFNALLVAYSAIYSIAPIARYLGSFKMESATFPGTIELVAHLGACLLIEDLMFYVTHRTLHTDFLYKHVHSWHHSFQNVIVLSSETAHPFEYSVGNLLPVTLGPLLLRSHLFTFCWFLALRVAVSHDEHCGFTIPWSPVRLLPFGSSSLAHSWHHSHTDGMYASQFSWWDSIFGTDTKFKAWAKKQRKEKL